MLVDGVTMTDLLFEKVELIFGFPHNYTHCFKGKKFMSDTSRLTILGKASSVQAFTALLKPLTFSIIIIISFVVK